MAAPSEDTDETPAALATTPKANVPKDKKDDNDAVLSMVFGMMGFMMCQLLAPLGLFFAWRHYNNRKAVDGELSVLAILGAVFGTMGTIIILMVCAYFMFIIVIWAVFALLYIAMIVFVVFFAVLAALAGA